MIEQFFNISNEIQELDKKVIELCKDQFLKIDEISRFNQLKVLSAFMSEKISSQHLVGTTGYGYDDKGRDGLDKLFAKIMKAEDALCRYNFMSGTHTLTVALFGLLRPGDTMLCVTGTPYDTLHKVVGIKESNYGSLIEFGIKYEQIDMLNEKDVNLEEIKIKAKNAKMCYIQRSRGYAKRKALTIEQIEEITKIAKEVNKDIIVMVDNCYGEFTQTKEPIEVGVDIIAGSLIKNPGGGIAPTGGYIAGRSDLVELCAHRLTNPGTGREVGCTLDVLRDLYLGIYMAPMTTANALKSSVYSSCIYENLGFETEPRYFEERNDIVTSITAKTPENVIAIAQAIQSASPIDSYVTPEPWAMPGYDTEVIMAAGTFIMGGSLELSCDAPIREPYIAYMQGGPVFETARAAILLSAQKVKEKIKK